MSTSTLLLSLFKYKAWANEELYAEMAKVDAAAHEAERHTAIRILNHIHVVDRIFAGHLSGTPHGFTATNTPQTPTLEELRLSVAATDQWYVAYVQSLAPELFEQKLSFVFTDGQNATMSREEMLVHVNTHGAYHRGAVGRILAQLGIAPPRDLLTRHLHIVEPERRQPVTAMA
ncbi:DinB family protein [Piscinibacter terrae]|uniref:Damage-inducible protein DinB n=1 Tax=Piscinibacter terrae TaxID=2496871 RepID=A0A3N7HQF6_9BURK|nr:DinB family protein [Albitalea terrae]RQP24457.1 damage-inducible protein DinB [Albitalea terrae]